MDMGKAQLIRLYFVEGNAGFKMLEIVSTVRNYEKECKGTLLTISLVTNGE